MRYMLNCMSIMTFTVALMFNVNAHADESQSVLKLRMGAGNLGAGKNKAELCQGCHGEKGMSPDGRVPNLAGQYAYYIAKELRDFQKGIRTHQIMSALAMTLDDADLSDIALYFSSQEKMQGREQKFNVHAWKIFNKGDLSRKIPACVSCHGENGKGKAPNISTYPVIGGQNHEYLQAQLVSWRSGERRNSPGAVMNSIARYLDDEEIKVLSLYISGL